MAAPTISDISPSDGHPGGGYILVITGTDFDVPTVTDPTSLPVDAPDDTMTVTIGGREATDIQVFSSTVLTCVCPAYRDDPADLSANPGLSVDVTVENIGPPSESTTVDDGFTYKRTDLTDQETNLMHVLDWIVNELRRQVILNVALMTHPDYDGSTSDGLDIVELASVPGIALFGPRILPDPNRQRRGYQDSQNLGTLEFGSYKAQDFKKLVFEVTLVGETPIESQRLNEEFVAFFQRNGSLSIPSDPSDPDSTEVELPIFLTSDPDRTGAANSAGTISSSATFEVHGVSLDYIDQIRVRYGKVTDDPADVRTRKIEE